MVEEMEVERDREETTVMVKEVERQREGRGSRKAE